MTIHWKALEEHFLMVYHLWNKPNLANSVTFLLTTQLIWPAPFHCLHMEKGGQNPHSHGMHTYFSDSPKDALWTKFWTDYKGIVPATVTEGARFRNLSSLKHTECMRLSTYLLILSKGPFPFNWRLWFVICGKTKRAMTLQFAGIILCIDHFQWYNNQLDSK
jgi:hypothetical protein